MSLEFIREGRENVFGLLENTEADIALGNSWPAPSRVTATPVLRSGYVVAGRKGGPIKKALTLKRYLAADHILVAAGEAAAGAVDRPLAERGKKRRVAAIVPDFTSALAIVSRTDTLTTIPTVIANRYARTFKLRVANPPLDIHPITVSMLRHDRRRKDDGVDWLSGEISAVALRFGGLSDQPSG